MCAIVHSGKGHQCAPAATNVQQPVSLLQTNLLADDGELVILELLKSLFLVRVSNDARGVDHARTKEPGIEVVATVIVVPNLVLILAARVADNIWNKGEEDVFEHFKCKVERGPVVATGQC